MQITSRRKFLKMLGLAGAGTMVGLPGFGSGQEGLKKLTILHTNDTHSRIDPYPANHPNYPGMGGYARRAAFIKHHRTLDPELLLLDAGDIFQGTPYFNLYGGQPEFMLMSQMKYDAATFGNHEFDNGLEGFAKALPHADFPFVSSNYDFSQTILAGKLKKSLILHRKGLKIGIYGLGIEPYGLVSTKLYGDTGYHDPLEVAREMEYMLWQKESCDLVICISHLGYDYQDDKVSDVVIARNTRHTDIIIGGHTHTLLDPPAVVKNLNNQNVYIGQAGYGGVRTGIMEIIFHTGSRQKFVDLNTTLFLNKQAV
jgi:5'-nucleotidase